MSREDLHFRLRIPAGLKAEIEASAAENNRSMTAEIVQRLSGSSPDQRTLRDWFAGQALAGIASNWELTGGIIPPEDSQEVAADAYAIADAMLAERAKGGAS